MATPAAGVLLRLGGLDWRAGGFTLFLRVEKIHTDRATPYGSGWVWVTGEQLARDGTPMGRLEALVRVSALGG